MAYYYTFNRMPNDARQVKGDGPMQRILFRAIDDPKFSGALPPLSDQAWLRILSTAQSQIDENERLEWLGDAVMHGAVGRQIYLQIPDGTPHLYTVSRNVLESNVTFCRLAEKLDVLAVPEEVLRALSRRTFGEGINAPSKTWRQVKITADLFEVVIGAYYLEAGFESLCAWVAELYEPLIRDVHNGYFELKRLKRLRYRQSPDFSRKFHYVPSSSRVFAGPVLSSPRPAFAASPLHRYKNMSIINNVKPSVKSIAKPRARETVLRRATSAPPTPPQPQPICIDLTMDTSDDDFSGPSLQGSPDLLAPAVTQTTMLVDEPEVASFGSTLESTQVIIGASVYPARLGLVPPTPNPSTQVHTGSFQESDTLSDMDMGDSDIDSDDCECEVLQVFD